MEKSWSNKAFSYFPSFSFTFTIMARNEGELPHISVSLAARSVFLSFLPFRKLNNLCFPQFLDIFFALATKPFRQRRHVAFYNSVAYASDYFLPFYFCVNHKQETFGEHNKPSIWCARWYPHSVFCLLFVLLPYSAYMGGKFFRTHTENFIVQHWRGW